MNISPVSAVAGIGDSLLISKNPLLRNPLLAQKHTEVPWALV